MDISIFLLLYKERMRFKIILLRVLKDEICTRMKDILGEDLVRNISQTFYGIWWVGKDDVELLPADLKELEDVVAYHSKVVHTELGSLRLDEIRMQREHLHTIHTGSASRRKLI